LGTGLTGGCLRLTGSGGTPTETATSRTRTQQASESATEAATEIGTSSPTDSETESATESPTELERLSVDGEWPQYRFDETRRGYRTDTTGPTEEIEHRWTFERGDVPERREADHEWPEFNPVVADDSVYVASQDGGIYSISVETGEQEWRFSESTSLTDPNRKSTPAVSDGTVLSEGSGGHIYAIDAETGEKSWQLRANVENSYLMPAVSDGVVFLVFDGDVYAIDPSDGSINWYREETGWVHTLTVGGGTVFATAVTESSRKLYALDQETGETRWETSGPSIGCSYHDGTVYTGRKTFYQEIDGSPELIALDATDGAVKWTRDVPATFGAEVSPPAVGDGTVYAGLYDGNVYAFDATDGSQNWVFKTRGDAIKENPVVVDDHLYFGTFWPGWVYCVSRSGDRKWSYPLPESAHQPAVVDGAVFITDSAGNLHAFAEQ
jgi:outer membrane protein assembly factor BamB